MLKFCSFLAPILVLPAVMVSFYAIAVALTGILAFPLCAVSAVLFAKSVTAKRRPEAQHD